ncbi:heme ABC transporter ATP-binding protein [Antrihabitans sp. YC2-6]|uniref:heme ABC transporter ATP-binding protein n=1 Tax=Antrihabitans sp. YC2-6 TaxID=2799498 RepID=UPI0018F7117E|nr:heme ABC transporter ATP-binding protein [Antrihabitans sp. YC2-6]MBJ8345635.1 heme ABC transporter ATP-binding protein [Antrihabitans sp. YC2-6]
MFVRRLDVPTAAAPGTVTMSATGVSVDRRGRRVLEEIDFDVVAGEIAALVGPNGAGKSTLLAALSGDQRISSGSIALDGAELRSWAPIEMAQRRAVLPQSHTVGFAFTARQIVGMGRAPWRRTLLRDEDDHAVSAALAACDALEYADRPFLALSGGERARVALARVLAQGTGTLLLDEPTAALDLAHQEAVMRLVRNQADAGGAIVVVLHDLGLAAAYADRVAVLENGRKVADGPPREVLSADLLTKVYGHPVEVLAHPETGAQLVLPRR